MQLRSFFLFCLLLRTRSILQTKLHCKEKIALTRLVDFLADFYDGRVVYRCGFDFGYTAKIIVKSIVLGLVALKAKARC
jgi:hypothetical protein